MAAEVRCSIRGEDIEEGTECMYYVPLPVTHSVLSELFPFEGRFHFRLKVPGEKLNLIEEFVWLDISPGKEEVTFARSMNTLEIQAIAIDFPRSERPDAEDDYITYMENVNQELGFNPSTRPPRGSLEDRESSSTSKGDLLRKFTKGVKKRTINAAQTIAPLSLHSVTSGASSLWNSVKATASQIQASIKQTSSLTDVSEDNLAQLADDCTCNYNDGNSRHAQLLRDLWAALQLGLNYERVSEKWKEVGWQKTDPVNDLKTSGVLAIRALTYLGRKFPDKCLAMVTKNKANVKANYPFAIVGVNITLLLAELFHLRDHKYLSVQSGHWDLFEDANAFFEIFCICFLHVDAIWTHRNAVRADFGKIIGEAKSLVSQVLSSSPRNVNEFKHIAAEEGMLVTDLMA